MDLLVLEGMGRAIHTNLYTRFKCECLKVAVLKNKWLAQHLGGQLYFEIHQIRTCYFSGDMFSVVFKYEVPSTDGDKLT